MSDVPGTSCPTHVDESSSVDEFESKLDQCMQKVQTCAEDLDNLMTNDPRNRRAIVGAHSDYDKAIDEFKDYISNYIESGERSGSSLRITALKTNIENARLHLARVRDEARAIDMKYRVHQQAIIKQL